MENRTPLDTATELTLVVLEKYPNWVKGENIEQLTQCVCETFASIYESVCEAKAKTRPKPARIV